MKMQFPKSNGGGQGPVLSDNMPKLSAGLTRGVNKTAVAYIVLVSLATIGMTLWVASNAFSADDDKKKQVTYEEVTVPEKPLLKLPPPAPPVDVVARADVPPMPPAMPMGEGAAPVKDDLMQRRMASENNLVAASEKGKKNPLFEDEFSAVKRGAVEVLANADEPDRLLHLKLRIFNLLCH